MDIDAFLKKIDEKINELSSESIETSISINPYETSIKWALKFFNERIDEYLENPSVADDPKFQEEFIDYYFSYTSLINDIVLSKIENKEVFDLLLKKSSTSKYAFKALLNQYNSKGIDLDSFPLEYFEEYKDEIYSIIEKSSFYIANHIACSRHILDLIMNDSSLDDDKRFEYLTKFDASIIDFDILQKYEKQIMDYFSREFKMFNNRSWRENAQLFNFVVERNIDTIGTFDVEITPEILEKYGKIMYEKMSSGKLFLPDSWKKSALLRDYVVSIDPGLICLFDVELTPELLQQYGKAVIEKINSKKFYNINDSWLKNESFIEFALSDDPMIIGKLKLDLTHELIVKYEDAIIKNIEDSFVIEFNWKNSEELFALVLEKYPHLVNKITFDLTPEILDKYGDKILAALSNNVEFFRYPWNKSELLFDFLIHKNNQQLLCFDVEFVLEKLISSHNDVLFEIIGQNVPRIWKKSDKLKEFLKKNQRYDLFAQMKGFTYEDFNDKEFLSMIAKGLEMDESLIKYFIDYLYKKNDEMFDTIDLRILKRDFLPMQNLSNIILYEDLEGKIIDLDDNALAFLSKLFMVIESKNYDTTAIFERAVNNIKKYQDLLTSGQVLSDEQMRNFIFILQKDNCPYKISSLEDLKDENFELIKANYFKSIADNIDSLDIEEIRRALFEKMYGLDLETVKFICQRYFVQPRDFERTDIDSNIVSILKNMAALGYDGSDISIEQLKEIFLHIKPVKTDFYGSVAIEAAIRKEYSNMYKKTLYTPNEMHKTKNPQLQSITYQGKSIDVYELSGDFNMQIHALGAYREWTRPENFKEDWLRPKIAFHGICTSYIGNNQIATARPNHPILAFADYESSALLLAGNYDLASDQSVRNYSSSIQQPYKLLPPRLMIDKTRHNHNEMVIERMRYGDGQHKRLPSYVVYIVDSIDNPKNFSENNVMYQETLQAAHDFDLPIVVVDRLKYCKYEMQKCLNLEKQFLKNPNADVLENLILAYMNNSVGCRIFKSSEEEVVQIAEFQKIFSIEVVKSFYERIISFIEDRYVNIDKKIHYPLTDEDFLLMDEAVKIIERLGVILRNEKDSYSVSHKAALLEPPINLDEEIERVARLNATVRQKLEEIKIHNLVDENEEERKNQK